MREDVILAHAECAALCEHIHLPLQSGSSPILKPMRRTYNRERYLDRVALIREHVPDCALTTDIIVGFPGETEEDFAATLEVVEEVGYDGAFTFVFSPRRGTEAADWTTSCRTRSRSSAWSGSWSSCSAARERAQRFVGRTMEVLVEGPAAPTRRACAAARRHNKAVNFEGTAAAGRAGRGRDHRGHLADAERPRAAAQPRRLARLMHVRRDLRADRGRQDRRRDRAGRAAARARRGPRRRQLRLDPGLPRAGDPQRRADAAERERLEHRLRRDRPIDGGVQRRPLRRARARRDRRRCSTQGRRPIVVGGTGLYLRAALAELELRPPVPRRGPRRGRGRPGERAARRRCTRSSTRELARRRPPQRPQADRPPDRAAAPGIEPHTLQRGPVDRGAPPARRVLVGLTLDRDELRARIDARVDAMVAARRRGRGARGRRGRRLAHRPLGDRLRGAARRRRRAR